MVGPMQYLVSELKSVVLVLPVHHDKASLAGVLCSIGVLAPQLFLFFVLSGEAAKQSMQVTDRVRLLDQSPSKVKVVLLKDTLPWLKNIDEIFDVATKITPAGHMLAEGLQLEMYTAMRRE